MRRGFKSHGDGDSGGAGRLESSWKPVVQISTHERLGSDGRTHLEDDVCVRSFPIDQAPPAPIRGRPNKRRDKKSLSALFPGWQPTASGTPTCGKNTQKGKRNQV